VSFPKCQSRLQDLPGLLCNGYRVSFPAVKRPERGVNHPLTSSCDVNVSGVITLLLLCAFVTLAGEKTDLV
jgi:hypothetical protein